MKELNIKANISISFIDDNLLLSKEKRFELAEKVKNFLFLKKENNKYFVFFFGNRISFYTKDLLHLRDINISFEKAIVDFNMPEIAALKRGKSIFILDLINNKIITKVNVNVIKNLALLVPILAIERDEIISIFHIKKKDIVQNININERLTKIEFLSKKILILAFREEIMFYNIFQKKLDHIIELEDEVINFYITNQGKYLLINIFGKILVYDLETKEKIETISIRNNEDLLDIKEIMGFWILIYEQSIDVIDFNTKEIYLLEYDKEFSNKLASCDEENLFILKEDYSLMTINIPSIFSKKSTKSNVIKIMTVDDSITIRRVIKNAIKNHFKDVEVFEAGDGYECLEVLEKHPDIDIIFMDWNMPEMDGKTAVEKINLNPRYKHVKIVMATTEGTRDKVKEMIKLGVVGYLVKPLKPDAVFKVTDKLIKAIRKERRNAI